MTPESPDMAQNEPLPTPAPTQKPRARRARLRKSEANAQTLSAVANVLGIDINPEDKDDELAVSYALLSAINDVSSKNNINNAEALQQMIMQRVVQSLLNAEMNAHMQYKKYERRPASSNIPTSCDETADEETAAASCSDGDDADASTGDVAGQEGASTARRNYRNGSYRRKARTDIGDIMLDFPRDRCGTFSSAIMPKGNSDLCGSRERIMELVARGVSVRDISALFKSMLKVEVSQQYIQDVVNSFSADFKEWHDRELQPFYPFIFIDCLYVPIRNESGRVCETAVYAIPGIDMQGKKDLLSLEIFGKDERKSDWLNVFSKLQSRGLKDTLFVSMDGVKGVDKGIQAMFPNAITQRCMVHMVRNSCEFVDRKDRAAFCKLVKQLYTSLDLDGAQDALRRLREQFITKAEMAVLYWEKHFDQHVAPLYDFPMQIRNVIYTTNAIESVNSSLRKVVKKGCYNSNQGALVAMFLRTTKVLSNNWQGRSISNWPVILNQLLLHERTSEVVSRYQPQ